MSKNRNIVLAFATAGLLGLALAFTANGVPLKDFTATEVTQLLSALFVISLLMERALEVFINVWRQPDAAQKERQYQAAQDALATAQKGGVAADIAARQAALLKIDEDLTDYRSGTQRLALWTAFFAGLVVSAVGPRALQTFVNAAALQGASDALQGGFHLIDILLTGGLLAGGSEGLHKITQVYTNYMEAAADKAKEKTGP